MNKLHLAIVASVLAIGGATADELQDVDRRLEKARADYAQAEAKWKQRVGPLVDEREKAARQSGDAARIEQAVADKATFTFSGDLPGTLPADAVRQFEKDRATLAAAFTAATKDYDRLNDKTAARILEREAQRFSLSTKVRIGPRTYLAKLKHLDVVAFRNAFDVKASLPFQGHTVPNGIFLHPPERGFSQMRYQLEGGWSTFRTTVGMPHVDDRSPQPGGPMIFEVYGDEKLLWQSKPVARNGLYQTAHFNIAGVKVLSLRVVCPEANSFAYATWIEPTLVK